MTPGLNESSAAGGRAWDFRSFALLRLGSAQALEYLLEAVEPDMPFRE